MSQTYGFTASSRQYVHRFTRWGLRKNISHHTMSAMVAIWEQRRREGKETSFFWNRQAFDASRLDRFARRGGIISHNEVRARSPTPPGVRYSTPLPDGQREHQTAGLMSHGHSSNPSEPPCSDSVAPPTRALSSSVTPQQNPQIEEYSSQGSNAVTPWPLLGYVTGTSTSGNAKPKSHLNHFNETLEHSSCPEWSLAAYYDNEDDSLPAASESVWNFPDGTACPFFDFNYE
ncbi:hypothetical protein B0T14DRAFT_570385 [Immersiella caudata]|uniref:Clr5 domain-containing protein n=1 Tax=Immersiella caudata TaxID=314043 RepID=A0AA40BUT8_9PEZI|nr:hypothetical protein B0T14DRAFT_570385 [Immersiella caudata]